MVLVLACWCCLWHGMAWPGWESNDSSEDEQNNQVSSAGDGEGIGDNEVSKAAPECMYPLHPLRGRSRPYLSLFATLGGAKLEAIVVRDSRGYRMPE